MKYVGCSTAKRVLDGYLGSGNAIVQAVRDYGEEGFEIHIVSRHNTRLEALQAETVLIKKLGERYTLYNSKHNPNMLQWAPTRKPEKIRTDFRLDGELMEIVSNISDREGMSKTAVVNEALKMYFTLFTLSPTDFAEVVSVDKFKEAKKVVKFSARSDDRATEEMRANYENAKKKREEAHAKDEDGPEEMFSTVGPTDLMEKYGDQIRKQHKKLK